MLCRKCGKAISTKWGNVEYHPINCWPDHMKLPDVDATPFELALKEEFTEMALWAFDNADRSLQVALGCSEAGQECDRKLGYRMANVPAVRRQQDPWPAIVGTAIHAWWEKTVNAYQQAHDSSVWVTEMAVLPSPLVPGHTDLYGRATVLDWKFPSPDNLKKMKTDGPSQQYRTQVHLYGLGHVRAGRPVERVGIIAAGRQGWLKDMYVWTEAYDESVALAALQRVYDLAGKLIDLDAVNNGGVWDQIRSVPSRLCGWCEWYAPEQLGGASDKGCPGL